jgi:DNA-nicking Smr family endonuclease
MSDSDESELFRQQMRDVKRLRKPAHAPPTPKPRPEAKFTRADQREVLKESLLPPEDFATLSTGDELAFRRHHVPEQTLIRLRRGHFAVDAEIDLHGMTSAESKAALRDFLSQAVQQHLSCVRIIHGKGRGSGPRGPVLKNVVNQWLQRIDVVLAFGSARPIDGGSGAIYVLLRQQK